MTHTVTVSQQTENKLYEKAELSGLPVAEFVSCMIEDVINTEDSKPDMIEHLRSIGVIGAIEGSPREDGKPWSEVEAACDAD